MKIYLIFLILFLFASCDDSIDTNTLQMTSTNIEGKWNLKAYIDIDGIEHQSTYTIFGWYEQGFEFVGKDKFYPRYDPELRFDTEEWQTDYLVGPGNYAISKDTLTLSHGNQIYDYTLKVKDENTIELSNIDAGQNPWTGTWLLVRSN